MYAGGAFLLLALLPPPLDVAAVRFVAVLPDLLVGTASGESPSLSSAGRLVLVERFFAPPVRLRAGLVEANESESFAIPREGAPRFEVTV